MMLSIVCEFLGDLNLDSEAQFLFAEGIVSDLDSWFFKAVEGTKMQMAHLVFKMFLKDQNKERYLTLV